MKKKLYFRLLRQTEGLTCYEADIGMFEMTPFSSPGCRYFGISDKAHEKDLVVPGNAHIEMRAEVDQPISFVTQLFFIKKNV